MDLIPVRLESGLVVWHTPEQYAALWKGVDREAAEAMVAEPDEDYRPRNPAWQCMSCGSIRCDGERCSVRDEDEDL